MNKGISALRQDDGDSITQPRRAWIPIRYVLSFMVFWAFFAVYALRVNLSVAIVAMVNNTAITINRNKTSNFQECSEYLNGTGVDNNGDQAQFQKDGEFNWDEKTQGMILGAFFYGYVVTQVPGGRLAEKVGGKWLLGGGVFLTSLMTLLTPISAKWGVEFLIINRIITGLGEGVTYPSMYAIFAQWIPIPERALHVAISSIGSSVGTVVALPASALLCQHGFGGGWPSVFYVFGGIGCLWCVLWVVTITSTPEEHPTISHNELNYIQKNRDTSSNKTEFASIPWKDILTSLPVWACAITKFCNSWGFYMLLTDLPNYLKFIMHFSIEKNGWLNAVLYIASSITMMISGYLADFMRQRSQMSITNIRKIFQISGLIGPAICLAVIPFAECDRLTVILLLTSAMAINGITTSGDGPLILDMAPNYAGTVFGLTNGFSNLAGVFAPLVTGVLTQQNETIQSWGSVFYVSSVVYVCGALVFLFFGSASVQYWSATNKYKLVQFDGQETNSDDENDEMDDLIDKCS